MGEALDHNVILAAALPAVTLMWVWWLVRSWRGDDPPPIRRVPNWLVVTSALLLLVFAVVRNLSGTPISRWLYSDLYTG